MGRGEQGSGEGGGGGGGCMSATAVTKIEGFLYLV